MHASIHDTYVFFSFAFFFKRDQQVKKEREVGRAKTLMRHEAGADSHHKMDSVDAERSDTRNERRVLAYPNSDENIYVGNGGVDGRDNSEGQGVCQLYPVIRGNSDKASGAVIKFPSRTSFKSR